MQGAAAPLTSVWLTQTVQLLQPATMENAKTHVRSQAHAGPMPSVCQPTITPCVHALLEPRATPVSDVFHLNVSPTLTVLLTALASATSAWMSVGCPMSVARTQSAGQPAMLPAAFAGLASLGIPHWVAHSCNCVPLRSSARQACCVALESVRRPALPPESAWTIRSAWAALATPSARTQHSAHCFTPARTASVFRSPAVGLTWTVVSRTRA